MEAEADGSASSAPRALQGGGRPDIRMETRLLVSLGSQCLNLQPGVRVKIPTCLEWGGTHLGCQVASGWTLLPRIGKKFSIRK